MQERWNAHRIALIYAGFSVLWIILSDRVATWLAPDLANLILFQTFKGLFFVLASAALVFALVRNAERRLQRNETSLRLLFEKLYEGFSLHEVICDEAGQPIDHRFLAVNPAYEALLGLPANRIEGRTYSEIFPTSEKHWIEEFGRVALTGETVHHQYYHRELGRWFEISAYCPAPGQFAALSRDVTEDHQSEQLRRLQEERVHLALDGAELGMWDWQVKTGTFTCDARWAQMVGHTPTDFPATLDGWDALVHADDLSRVRAARDAHLLGSSPAYEVELRLRHASGHWVWVLSRGRVIQRDDDGRPLRVCGTHLDISDRKAAEEERDRLETQLRQAQKMEAVGQLAGGIAHDFNNLLQVINGYAELALADLPAEHAARGRRTRSPERQPRGRSGPELLAFSRRQMLSPEAVDLNETVKDLLQMLDRVLGENIETRFTPAASLPAITADRGMVEQVVMNLCVNSRDAMPNGGTLSLETAEAVIDQSFVDRHPWATLGRYVRLSVADSGTGMDANTLERAFEPFFSTKPPGAGTGLGLATVYGIVKQHRGIVRASSEPGRGSQFHVYFPISAAVEGAAVDPPAVHIAGGHETILLAEDDVAVRDLAQQILTKAGYQVLVAANGREAVSLFARHVADVDLLLMDVVMPDLGGIEAVELIRKIRPEVPAILASGYDDQAVAAATVADQGLGLLRKPFGRAELLRAIRQALSAAPAGRPPAP